MCTNDTIINKIDRLLFVSIVTVEQIFVAAMIHADYQKVLLAVIRYVKWKMRNKLTKISMIILNQIIKYFYECFVYRLKSSHILK